MLFEGAVIVTSILLAFLVQAWWENRQDRAAEAAYLEAITDEIERNIAALDGNVRVAEIRDRELSLASKFVEEGVSRDSTVVFLQALVGGARSAGPPRIATAVFDELTGTGRITLIQDLELRRQLLDLYAVIGVTFDRMARNAEQVDSRLFAEVARHLPAGSVSRGSNSNPTQVDLDLSRLNPSEVRALAEGLIADPNVRNELRAESLLRADETFYRARYRQALLEAKVTFGPMSQ